MTNELDDHKAGDKTMQPDVVDLGGADPELMHLELGTPQEDFDKMWREGDTVTEDGYLT